MKRLPKVIKKIIPISEALPELFLSLDAPTITDEASGSKLAKAAGYHPEGVSKLASTPCIRRWIGNSHQCG